MLKAVRNVVGSTIVAAFGGMGAFLVPDFIKDGATTLPEISCVVQDEYERQLGSVPQPPEYGMRVLVARLQRDRDREQTPHVVNWLRDCKGVEPQPLCRTLSIAENKDVTSAKKEAEETGRDWLRARNAMVVVWGEYDPVDKSTRLRFLPRNSGTAFRNFDVSEDLKIAAGQQPDPSDICGRLAIQNSATGGNVQQTRQGRNKYVAEGNDRYISDQLLALLPRLRERAKDIAAQPADEQHYIRDTYFASLSTLSSVTGENSYLQEMITFADSELARLEPADERAITATKYWRARALHSTGFNTQDAALVEQAVAGYRELLTIWTKERSPLNRASAENSLGLALRALGQMRNDDKFLVEAIAAHRAALEGFTRDKAPLDWGKSNNDLGRALVALGKKRNDLASIKQGIAAHQAALQVLTRADVAKDWATTQNYLANALRAAAAISKDPAELEQAVIAYQFALLERPKDKMAISWAGTQTNLGEVLLELGTLKADPKRIDEALAAFKGALDIYTQRADNRADEVRESIAKAEAGRSGLAQTHAS